MNTFEILLGLLIVTIVVTALITALVFTICFHIAKHNAAFSALFDKHIINVVYKIFAICFVSVGILALISLFYQILFIH